VHNWRGCVSTSTIHSYIYCPYHCAVLESAHDVRTWCGRVSTSTHISTGVVVYRLQQGSRLVDIDLNADLNWCGRVSTPTRISGSTGVVVCRPQQGSKAQPAWSCFDLNADLRLCSARVPVIMAAFPHI